MLDDFLVRAFLAGCALALAAGPLGCFVVWRRMAYFGDAISHAALLGVALSLAFTVSVFVGVLFVCIAIAIGLSQFHGTQYSLDTLLGVLSHVALALGLVVVSKLSGVRVDLNAYLFGDILAVSQNDVIVIWLGSLLTLAMLLWRWVPLLTLTLSPDLAAARGYLVRREQLALMISLAVLVAVAIKLVGALLITAMLIIPAAAARPIATTPEWMAVTASLLAVLSVSGGLGLSLYADTPAGPSIILAAGVLFLLVNVIASRRRLRHRHWI